MELRLKDARSTLDIDLALSQEALKSASQKDREQGMFSLLQQIAQKDLEDYFTFEITGPVQPMWEPIHGGARFHVTSQVGGKTFSKFHLDIVVADYLAEPLEKLSAREWLKFAGIPAQRTSWTLYC